MFTNAYTNATTYYILSHDDLNPFVYGDAKFVF